MKQIKYSFKRIGLDNFSEIKELFFSVFTDNPWNDDWSNEEQLDLYLNDLVGQSNCLTYGLYEKEELIAISLGHIKHWCTGTEYFIDELCVASNKQHQGIGKIFIKEIENDTKEMGIKHIILQTDKDVPAFKFYQDNGFIEMKDSVSFFKKI